jgi:hypothetical protein
MSVPTVIVPTFSSRILAKIFAMAGRFVRRRADNLESSNGGFSLFFLGNFRGAPVYQDDFSLNLSYRF